MSYAGDLTPQEAWTMLADNPQSVLIDVRTMAEWNYVGVPDLAMLGKETNFVEWVIFPTMEKNNQFIEQVRQSAPAPDAPVLFLCRSGVRSIAAAKTMTANGYSNCLNILQGFEGDKDANHHRGTLGGWRNDGLAWTQG